MPSFSLDFEFIDGNPCIPLSMGLVEFETERELYIEFPGATNQAACDPWHKANTFPLLGKEPIGQNPITTVLWYEGYEDAWNTRTDMIRRFIGNPSEAFIYAYKGTHDFFLFCELMGVFNEGSTWKKTFFEAAHLGVTSELIANERSPLDPKHHALYDARVQMHAIKRVTEIRPKPCVDAFRIGQCFVWHEKYDWFAGHGTHNAIRFASKQSAADFAVAVMHGVVRWENKRWEGFV